MLGKQSFDASSYRTAKEEQADWQHMELMGAYAYDPQEKTFLPQSVYYAGDQKGYEKRGFASVQKTGKNISSQLVGTAYEAAAGSFEHVIVVSLQRIIGGKETCKNRKAYEKYGEEHGNAEFEPGLFSGFAHWFLDFLRSFYAYRICRTHHFCCIPLLIRGSIN